MQGISSFVNVSPVSVVIVYYISKYSLDSDAERYPTRTAKNKGSDLTYLPESFYIEKDLLITSVLIEYSDE